jgi:hypothetical protein
LPAEFLLLAIIVNVSQMFGKTSFQLVNLGAVDTLKLLGEKQKTNMETKTTFLNE